MWTWMASLLLGVSCVARGPQGVEASGAVDGQGPPELLTPPCGLVPGARFDYVQERQDTDARTPELADMVLRVHTTLEVLGEGPEGLRVAVAQGVAELPGRPASPGPRAAALLATMDATNQPTRMVLVLDPARLTPQSVEDIEALRARLFEGLDAARPALAGDPDTAAQALAGVRALYADDAALTHALLKPVQPLFEFACGQYPLGASLPVDELLPSPMGGDPLRAQGVLNIGWPEAEALPVEVRWSVDPMDLMASSAAAMARAGLPGVKVTGPPPEGSVVHEGHAALRIGLAHGMPLTLTSTERLRLMGTEKLEARRATLLAVHAP